MKATRQVSPFLDACFDISLCGILALDEPHFHAEENSHTTYQVKLDASIAQNEVTHNLDCDIIIAVVENWQIDKYYTHFVTIHFSNHFQVYPNGQTAKVRSTSDLSNHRRLLRMSNTSLLAQLMYTDVSRGVPHTQQSPNVSFKDAPLATPQKEAVAHRKRPQTTWNRRSSLHMISMFSTEMKNAMTPRVQRVSSNTRTTTVLILIQN